MAGASGDGGVAQSGHDFRSGARADLAAVFVVGDIADPVNLVFDSPVLADETSDHLAAGLGGGQAGDAVYDLLDSRFPL